MNFLYWFQCKNIVTLFDLRATNIFEIGQVLFQVIDDGFCSVDRAFLRHYKWRIRQRNEIRAGFLTKLYCDRAALVPVGINYTLFGTKTNHFLIRHFYMQLRGFADFVEDFLRRSEEHTSELQSREN